MDICSGSTRLRPSESSPYEFLEPMKFYSLSDSDLIQFGETVVARFHVSPKDVQSSQVTQSFNTTKKHFYVPETEALNAGSHSQLTLIDLPETQSQGPDTQLINSETVLDFVSEKDETSNDAMNSMCSQSIFADTSLKKKSSSPQLDVDVDDGLDDFERLLLSKKKLSAPQNSQSLRDGSVTPDFLDFDGDIIRPEPMQIKIEPMTQPKDRKADIKIRPVKYEFVNPQVRQADIETQILDENCSFGDVAGEKTPDLLEQPTQPVISFSFRTRNQIKKQALIKPKTVSLTDFDETQQFIPTKRKENLFSMETQPVLPYIPVKDESSRKKVNRILLSSDESEEEQKAPKAELEEVQGIPKNKIFLTSSDESEAGESRVESTKTPKSTFKALPTTPARYSDSPLIFDTTTPEMIPKLPNDSQIGRILDLINASQPSNDSLVVFDAINEDGENEENINQQQVQKPEKMAKKRVRRKIMKYGSDSDEDEPGPSKKKFVEIAPKKSGNSSDQSKVYAIAISNISGPRKEKYIAMSEKLGCKIVDRVSDADILLSSETIKFTSKFLMAMCKGIPIVAIDFIDASTKNQSWLNPENFIVVDEATEKQKRFSLKNVLEKVKTTKMFAGCSVFVTSHSTIPFDEIQELVSIAGGECIQLTDVPNHKKIVLIYNSAERSTCKTMVAKYPNLIRLKDIALVKSVLLQKI